MNEILKMMNTNVFSVLSDKLKMIDDEAVEIRLRVNCPVLVKTVQNCYYMDYNGMSKNNCEKFYKVTKMDIDDTMSRLTSNSIHAFEKEIRMGYITVRGGHRVGIGGDCIYDGEFFKNFRNITSLNIRIAREFRGCSGRYLKFLITPEKNIYNTLVIGPPLSGKTTFIRDVAANLSDGTRDSFFEGCDITLIDERGEISSVYNGVPQMYVGRRTDILSYCMKKDGFVLSIRALSPKAIICDELGSKEDVETMQYALKSGVSVISTAHGFDLDDVKRNIYLKSIVENNFFDRAVILKCGRSPSKVKEIYDFRKNMVIYDDAG
jgi:stage III sporulation protein AA